MSAARVDDVVVYTVAEVAERLRLGRSAVYELMQQGRLRSFKVGRRRLVAHVDLVAFVDELRAESTW